MKFYFYSVKHYYAFVVHFMVALPWRWQCPLVCHVSPSEGHIACQWRQWILKSNLSVVDQVILTERQSILIPCSYLNFALKLETVWKRICSAFCTFQHITSLFDAGDSIKSELKRMKMSSQQQDFSWNKPSLDMTKATFFFSNTEKTPICRSKRLSYTEKAKNYLTWNWLPLLLAGSPPPLCKLLSPNPIPPKLFQPMLCCRAMCFQWP